MRQPNGNGGGYKFFSVLKESGGVTYLAEFFFRVLVTHKRRGCCILPHIGVQDRYTYYFNHRTSSLLVATAAAAAASNKKQ